MEYLARANTMKLRKNNISLRTPVRRTKGKKENRKSHGIPLYILPRFQRKDAILIILLRSKLIKAILFMYVARCNSSY